MKYPEKFEFWNRLGGATGLGHAYVIESDGIIREPDYNNLSNNNHKYKYSDWKNIADGTQGYMQILPGEIIVSYTKDYTAVPYIFNLEWADDEITEAQLEVICNELAEKAKVDIILEFENLINKESMINGVFNQECKDYIIDNLLKQIKKFQEI